MTPPPPTFTISLKMFLSQNHMNGKICKMYTGIAYLKKMNKMNVVLCSCFRNNTLAFYITGGGNQDGNSVDWPSYANQKSIQT